MTEAEAPRPSARSRRPDGGARHAHGARGDEGRRIDGVRRAVGYLRVSTEEQADSGLGLEAQRVIIEAEAARRDWELVEVLVDAGASGKSLSGRPALAEALATVRSADADVLVVAKLDRLSRSLLDFAGLMADAQARGWVLVALDLGIDLSTPAGEFMASVMASAAQWERRLVGQRTREALAVRRAQGVRLGRPPVLSQQVIDRIVAARATGMTLTGIAEDLNAAGLPTARGGARWYASTVRAVLHSQAAAGTAASEETQLPT